MTAPRRTLRQWICEARGHDQVFHFENQPAPLPCKVLLRCTSCGWDTPGLTPEPVTPRRTYAGDPRRHRLSVRGLLKLTARKDAA